MYYLSTVNKRIIIIMIIIIITIIIIIYMTLGLKLYYSCLNVKIFTSKSAFFRCYRYIVIDTVLIDTFL